MCAVPLRAYCRVVGSSHTQTDTRHSTALHARLQLPVACVCVCPPQAASSSPSSKQPTTQFQLCTATKGGGRQPLWLPRPIHHVTQTHTLGTGRAATAASPLHRQGAPHRPQQQAPAPNACVPRAQAKGRAGSHVLQSSSLHTRQTPTHSRGSCSTITTAAPKAGAKEAHWARGYHQLHSCTSIALLPT